MMPPKSPIRPLDDESRRATALSLLAENASQRRWRELPDGAKLMYTVGLLICNDCGHFTKKQLRDAMKSPETVAEAMALMFESGAA